MRIILITLILSLVVLSLIYEKLSIACCDSWSMRLLQTTSDYVVTYSAVRPDLVGINCSPLCNNTWSPYSSYTNQNYEHLSIVSYGAILRMITYPQGNGKGFGNKQDREWKDVGIFFTSWSCINTSSYNSWQPYVASDFDTGSDCTDLP